MKSATSAPRLNRRKARGGIEYRLVYLLGFVFFLAAAVISRAAGFVTLKRRGDQRSVWRQAREATGATIPYAFLG